MSELPAILGGKKAFPEGVPFAQPTIPDWNEIAPELEAMYRTGYLTKGPYMRKFEEAMEEYLGVKHVVAVSSCTSGLMLALQSLDLNLSKAEVIVPAYSFMATFHALKWNGLKPVFVDCEPESLTIDVKAAEKAIGPNTVGIMAACVCGNPPDWKALEALSEKYGLPVFCDSAHGLGTIYEGKRLGGRGKFEAFSLSPTKLLTSAEGGLVSTNDDQIAKRIREGRDYGNPGTYDCFHAGLNARMSEFHAILGLKGVPYLEQYAAHRNEAAAAYRKALAGIPGITFQKIRENTRSSYKDFAMFIDPEKFGMERDMLTKALNAEGVPTRAYFCPAGHEMSVYAYLPKVTLPVTEFYSRRVICPPIFSHMELSLAERIGDTIRRIHEHADEVRK